ncbi:hypothetical protein CDL12_19688 [Handroanthus impetiginosus]|uniref:GAG-pre-integrase domain-containing protein n=1 Tax=Handroanthus impetiginosus TaxID=429701 RepID=A0A2G9GRA4_9LAMI|nr:hypothetical protein CDL12_19688 [Handroanthus impetiginosus]
MDISQYFIGPNINMEEICLADSATTHTILRNKKYFSCLMMREANVTTISGSTNLIEGSRKANILLPGGTRFVIDDALFSSKSQRNLLSFKDIRRNGYHIETTNDENIEYLQITMILLGKKCILEKLPAFSSGLYYTNISTIETHAVVNQKFIDTNTFTIWHDQLGHPGSIMM